MKMMDMILYDRLSFIEVYAIVFIVFSPRVASDDSRYGCTCPKRVNYSVEREKKFK